MKTVFKPFAGWWRKPEHNLKEIVFTPIASDRPLASQRCCRAKLTSSSRFRSRTSQRVNASANAKVLTGPELRTIFIGMDQLRDELLYSNVKGKNPFKDVRVREAFYKAIDVDLIKSRVMRGLSTPSALMIAPELFPLSKEFVRPKADPDARQEAHDRGRLSGWLRSYDGLPERPLCQRCRDLPGGGRHAGAHRRERSTCWRSPRQQYFAKVLKPGGFKPRSIMLGWHAGIDGFA